MDNKPISCSVDGCDKRPRSKGLCHPHYMRLLRHGNPLGGKTNRGEAARFYEETVLSYDGKECLIWPYGRSTDGYGKIWRDGKLEEVHRLVCEEANGPPPTPRHQAAHECGRGGNGCVSKGHLVWKTKLENEADKNIHGTHSRGARHGQAKLTEEQVREIRSLKGTESQKSIADRLGIAQQHVSGIQSGKKWAWINQGSLAGGGE